MAERQRKLEAAVSGSEQGSCASFVMMQGHQNHPHFYSHPPSFVPTHLVSVEVCVVHQNIGLFSYCTDSGLRCYVLKIMYFRGLLLLICRIIKSSVG